MQDNLLGNEVGSTLQVAITSWNIRDNQTKANVDLDPSPKHIAYIEIQMAYMIQRYNY